MPFVLILMTVSDFLFIALTFRSYKAKKDRIALLTGILCLGLFYDSLILSCGSFLQFGPFFKALSQFRYVLHCLLIPLLFPICAYSFKADRKLVIAVWALTAVIMAVGLYSGFHIVTEERVVGAIRRYAQSDNTPAFANTLVSMLDILPVFFMIGTGAVLSFKKKNPNLMLAGIFMLLFTLAGIFLGKDPNGDRTQSLMFYISMFGESFMVFFLYRFILKNEQ